VLRAELLTNPAILAQLQREAELARQLVHPHIIQVYECNVAERRPYLAMEYIPDARTLRYGLATFVHFAPAHAVELAAQVAEALAYGYATYRLVHRDVKPENLLIDPNWQVKVLDFGLASATTRSLAKATAQGDVAQANPGPTPSRADVLAAL